MAIGISAFSCTLLVDANKAQCASDSDCTSRGAEFANSVCSETRCVARVADSGQMDAGPDADGAALDSGALPPQWSCVGSRPWHARSDSETVLRHERFGEYGTEGTPVVGVAVRACNASDLDCTKPLAQPGDAGPIVYSDSTGLATLTVPRWFDGFLRAEPGGDAIPLNIYILPPPDVAGDGTQKIPVPSMPSLEQMGALVGVTILPNRGHISLALVDCDNQPAAGLSVTVTDADDLSKVIYLDQVLPNATAQATLAPLARVVMANLTSDKLHTVVAKYGDIPVLTATFTVRAGTLITAVLPPQ